MARKVPTIMGPVAKADYEEELTSPVNRLLDIILGDILDAGGVALFRWAEGNDSEGVGGAAASQPGIFALNDWRLALDTPERRDAIPHTLLPRLLPAMLTWLAQRAEYGQISFHPRETPRDDTASKAEAAGKLTKQIRLSPVADGEHFLKLDLF